MPSVLVTLSASRLHRSALTVLLVMLAVFVFAPGVRAQGIATATKVDIGSTTSTITNFNNGYSSWEPIVKILQAWIEHQTAAITQLQAALAAETAARQKADADALAAAKQYADGVAASEAAARQQGDAAALAAAKQYADAVVASEAAARQQGDAATLAGANVYTDSAFSNEAAMRASADAALQAQIDAIRSTGGGVPQQLLDIAPYLSVDVGTINGLPGPHVILTGVNLHVRNGQPAQYDSWPTFNTASYAANGRGNLIIGYNDDGGQSSVTSDRGGSHNVVIGDLHRFIGNGGFLSGWANSIGANANAVSGYSNGASGWAATVSGGELNFAAGPVSHVTGGFSNTASGEASSVTGGLQNTAAGNYSTIAGGYLNSANGFQSSVAGGQNNRALGDASSVSGGDSNTAEGLASSVAGGHGLTASGDYSTQP